MKMLQCFCVLMMGTTYVTACGDTKSSSDKNNKDNGQLVMKLTVGDYAKGAGKSLTRDINTALDLVDIRHIVFSLAVTTDTVAENQPDNLTWHEILAETEEHYDSERAMSQDLPPGTYQAVKIIQSNYLYWVCTDGVETYELYSLNNSGAPADTHILNIFANDGMYSVDGGNNFTVTTTGEKMGTAFEIIAGKTTQLTLRNNLDTLDWNDADNSGNWSAGDSLDNWTTIPGTTTMVDFIVE